MKIVRKTLDKISLEEFADKHGLTMIITERNDPSLPRFYAAFEGVEVVTGDGMLRAAYGNGQTEDEAIADYKHKISGEQITIDADTPKRQEIIAPWFN